jgi:co-chaperonin GroES (HSP10)
MVSDIWQSRRLIPARGYAAVREIKTQSSVVYLPDLGAREKKTQRGVVVDLGAPPRTVTGAESPWPFKVGDVVQYHFEFHEQNRTIPWQDGETVVMLTMDEIDLVFEGGGS